jgi:hypothetical protein
LKPLETRCKDEELQEATKGLEPQDGSVEKEKFEVIGDTKPKEPQVPEMNFKPLPKGLKYKFLDPNKTYLVIVSDELSPTENEKLLNLLKSTKTWLVIQLMISNDLAQPFALIVYRWRANVTL